MSNGYSSLGWVGGLGVECLILVSELESETFLVKPSLGC